MALEPLFSLEVAAELIPISILTLVDLLDNFPDEFSSPVYHTMTGSSHNIRMLTESDCLKAREFVIKRKSDLPPDGYFIRRGHLFRGRGLPRQHTGSVVRSLRVQVA